MRLMEILTFNENEQQRAEGRDASFKEISDFLEKLETGNWIKEVFEKNFIKELDDFRGEGNGSAPEFDELDGLIKLGNNIKSKYKSDDEELKDEENKDVKKFLDLAYKLSEEYEDMIGQT